MLDARAARITWTVFLIGLLIWVTWLVRDSIMIFVLALFLAYILYPLVRLVERFTPPRFPHTAALAIVYVLLLGLIAGGGIWLGSRLVSEGQALADQFPALIEKSGNLEAIPVPSWLEPYKLRVIAFVREQTSASADRIMPLLQRAMGGVAGLLGSLGLAFIVPILTFLFLKDAVNIREYMLGWVSSRRRRMAGELLDDIHKLLADYIRSLVILSALTAVCYAVFFQAIGLRYALLISVAAAFFEFIPYVGPLLGTIMVILVAVFTNFPHLWWILIFFAAYRAVQDYFIQPNLLAQGTQLHPLVVFFGAFAGEALGGLWGMFLSVPVLAAIRIILVRVYKHRRTIEEPEEAPVA